MVMQSSINILALDTSSNRCSIAVKYNNNVDEIYAEEIDRSKNLLTLIQRLLNEISLNQINVLAFAAGPGSLTGLKIGSSIIQAINLVYQKPIIKVSTLETLAFLANEQYGNSIVIPYIDAKMGQIYYGAYEFSTNNHELNKIYKQIHKDTVGVAKDFLELSKLNPDALVVSNEIGLFTSNKVDISAKSIIKIADYHYKKYGIIITNDSNPIYLCSYK
jgi:tRNA threonylcarbamoyl adenosine modification protein YeaZ